MNKIITLTSALLGAASLNAANPKPNVIVVLADDLGYGDVSGLNPDSKINTPNIDGMCGRGIVFTDAHGASALSTPSRYALMTGRYPWRTALKDGVSSGFSPALIPEGRNTIGDMFRDSGYSTACIGKWHLGWDWPKNGDQIDYSAPIPNSPNKRGFDYFFGLPASLDMAPYVFVENDRVTSLPTATLGKGKGLLLMHGGVASPDFKPEECLPTLINRSLDYIGKQKGADKPFFLYLPITAPHTPVLPTPEFQGRTKVGPYGDFVVMVDDMMGKIFDQLKKSGMDKNTIVIFASDNGCAPYVNVKELERQGHFPSYIYRGYKSDIFEGGHRIPLIVTWGDHYKSRRNESSLVCLADLYATFANMLNYKIGAGEAEDSNSFLAVLNGKGKADRKDLVVAAGNGMMALRTPEFKLVFGAGSGGWTIPVSAKDDPTLPPMQLYNIAKDPSEKENLIVAPQYAGQIAEMTALMRKYVAEGRSTKGPAAKNDTGNDWRQAKLFMDAD